MWSYKATFRLPERTATAYRPSLRQQISTTVLLERKKSIPKALVGGSDTEFRSRTMTPLSAPSTAQVGNSFGVEQDDTTRRPRDERVS